MKINTNSWNRIRYSIYAPLYDFFIARVFKNSRRRSIQSLGIGPYDKVLIVGAGTGLDLPFIPESAEVVATDITPAMIHKINRLNQKLGYNLQAKVMDGQKLEFEDGVFDKVILHLILAVIPDPVACIKECERVLKKGGEIAVFDKFLKKGHRASVVRKALNLFANLFFSDINRDFYSIVEDTRFEVVSDAPADFNGNFRIIRLKKAEKA